MTKLADRIIQYYMHGENYASANLSDFYHLTTGQVLHRYMDWKAYGTMVLRGDDGKSSYGVMAGMQYMMPIIAKMIYDDAFIDWARGLKNPDGTPKLKKNYLESLRGKPLNVTVDAIPDGHIIYPGPLAYIGGDPIAAKWVDTSMADMFRRCIALATKISRLLWAAKGKVSLAENGMRRAGDPAGFIAADICTMMGVPTSNMSASQANGTTPIGTMDHYYISFLVAVFAKMNKDRFNPARREDRIEALKFAYRSYIEEFPEYGAFLLDLAPLDEGVDAAIQVLNEFHPRHYSMRDDSGDLAAASHYMRQKFNEAGHSQLIFSLTGGLRAINLDALLNQEADMGITGIGEYLGPRGELPRDLHKGLFEIPVNTEIVTKLSLVEAPDGDEIRTIKISDEPLKASRGGNITQLRIPDPEAEGATSHIEVDLTRMAPLTPDGRLTAPLTSRRWATGKTRTYPAGTQVVTPYRRLVANGKYLGENILTHQASFQRYTEDFGALDEKYKTLGGNPAAPTGIELSHFEASRAMAESGALISWVNPPE